MAYVYYECDSKNLTVVFASLKFPLKTEINERIFSNPQPQKQVTAIFENGTFIGIFLNWTLCILT